jgi:hypothetical protein
MQGDQNHGAQIATNWIKVEALGRPRPMVSWVFVF